MAIKLRAPGNYDPNVASLEAAIHNFEPTRTQQHQADETDINLIVKRYMQTGILPQTALAPLYGDFSEPMSFHEAQNRIRAAQEAFMLIPPEIRARFDNDPGKFVAFAEDPANEDELVRLKLRNPRPAPSPSQGATGSPNGGAAAAPATTPAGGS